jgi:hypothetical protein
MKPDHGLQSLPTVICGGDLKSRHFENLGQSIGDAAFIIDDKDLRKVLLKLAGVGFRRPMLNLIPENLIYCVNGA